MINWKQWERNRKYTVTIKDPDGEIVWAGFVDIGHIDLEGEHGKPASVKFPVPVDVLQRLMDEATAR